jgi:cellulose biosynthesis protein BcsQ
MNTTMTRLQYALRSLPENAPEAVVDSIFSTQLLEALGFQQEEIFPKYATSHNRAVDKAARKTVGGNIFLHTKTDPYLLLELKAEDFSLSPDTATYQKTVNQLKEYLLGSSCHAAQWGIITNSCHIQLFRKHGRVIFPATQCLSIDEDNVDAVVASIREKIEQPTRALTVAIYNNKGGVGKTTTTINLAGILTFLGKKVLTIDFDPNQQDLTKALGLSLTESSVFEALTDRDIELGSAIKTYSFPTKKAGVELSFDVIPADRKLANQEENLLRNYLKSHTLYQKLEVVKQQYDYILIDAPPNWRVFSKLAVYAADVVLIPTKHNSFFSLENAATAIKQSIPEMQAEKGDGSPVALPIFFNGEKITLPQLAVAQQEINSILKTAKKEKIDLLPYFYPRYTNAKQDLYIPQVPSYAGISGSAFSRVPAVYRDRSAHEYYKALAKEYFLQ